MLDFVRNPKDRFSHDTAHIMFQCKYDFCWVCLDQWKRHNSSTGGYFKCNRYEVSKKVEDTSKEQIKEVDIMFHILSTVKPVLSDHPFR